MYNFETDVLVVGGGGAGAMAACEASKHNARVLLVSKGLPQRSGATVMAPGAIAGVGSWAKPGDSKDLHFLDTIKGGANLNEQGLVRALVDEAPDLILELEQMGAMWQRDDSGGNYALRIDGGHSFPRCPFLEDRTGREMLRTLFGEVAKRLVRVIPNIIVLRLINDNGRVSGALGLDLTDCQPVLLRAKAVILACGGAGNLYINTSNPTDVTGDGYALALQAGAALMDMEFVQFYPLGFLFPASLRGTLGALLYHIRLRNSKHERFMEKYEPERLELTTRDKVARAMMTEIREGRGGPLGGVFADMTYHEPGFIARMQPALYQTYQKIGINPDKDYLEVAPTCHFFMGGARVDKDWQSTVPGLYIAGETGAGVHGANRLSQNALAEILVSGKRAGKAAAQFAKENAQEPIQPSQAQTVVQMARCLLDRETGIRPTEWRNRLRQLMWDKVGVFRTQSGLESVLQDLAELEAELELQSLGHKTANHNRELMVGLENHFLVTTAKCVAKAALLRTESRGAHYREDFPLMDDRGWLRHVLIYQDHNGLKTETIAVDLAEVKPGEGGSAT